MTIRGELGAEDAVVLSRLMEHAVRATGLPLSRAEHLGTLRPGEFGPMVLPDGSCAPGKVQVLCQSAAEVDALHAALHGQSVRVGSDIIGVTVDNDQKAALPLTGNRRGAHK